jgi:hypothetical protein
MWREEKGKSEENETNSKKMRKKVENKVKKQKKIMGRFFKLLLQTRQRSSTNATSREVLRIFLTEVGHNVYQH